MYNVVVKKGGQVWRCPYRFNAFRSLNLELLEVDGFRSGPFAAKFPDEGNSKRKLGIKLSEKELQSRCVQLDRWLGVLTSSMDDLRLVPNAAKFVILKFLHMR
mmetsp:Transcript_93416/g.267329  ORF Transcript_93416/g.267329 Transcript_93416/m.267329 type:complete len:103 (-) Transcript_93416:303-611(-)